MNSTLSITDEPIFPRTTVTLARWVNEPLPPVQELLSAHNVARLTRRPKLVISSLILLGRFPKKRRYRGRQVGWLRSDVLDWLARDIATAEALPLRSCTRAWLRQPRPPLECAGFAAQRQRACSGRRRGRIQR